MVGDRVVLVVTGLGRRDHSLQGDDAVGEVGMRVQVSAQVFPPNEGGCLFGCFRYAVGVPEATVPVPRSALVAAVTM